MRKVKNAKDLSTNELIYFKGHAKATYMSDGTTVEDAINNIEVGSGTDLSDYVTKEELNSKQDKLVSGTNIKTINGTSIIGSGDIEVSAEGNQVQSDWDETDADNPAYIKNKPNITRKYLNIQGYGGGFLTPLEDIEPLNGISMDGLEGVLISAGGLTFIPEDNVQDVWKIHNKGNGTKFLSDDGTYKEVSGGGSDYATKEELNSKQDTITDLEAIRQGAAKGATALQSYIEQYKGTVTGVKVNGTTKSPSNGVVDLGTVITSHQDISGKQDKLVSGTNIKTINGNSLLGSGDITISGSGNQLQSDWNETDTTSPAYIANKPNINLSDDSAIDLYGSINMYTNNAGGAIILSVTNGQISLSYPYKTEQRLLTIDGTGNGTKFLADDGTYKEISGGSSSGSGSYGLVEHGTSDTTFSLTPNTFHVWDEVTELTLTFEEETAGVANEYLFQFESGTEPTVFTLPDNIVWANDEIPIIESGYIYQVSILKGFATLMRFVKPLIINFPYTVTDGKDHSGLYNYLISKYNINSSASDSPDFRVEINEIIIVEDNSYGGEVLGISLYNGKLLLWTQNAIESEWEVMYINANGGYGGYVYD